ncbi:MAG: hypothetical protein HKN40_00015 [Winogradskyella sp.]|uniref:hypothetical protein n=1 Tax=Winogradskyella sp. TaxID=1883156 RepID=UPI001855D057|nr:hypothetical protein [Winogradskyella sp.]
MSVLIYFHYLNQVGAVPTQDNLIYWMLGVLVVALGGALAYVKTQHTEQIKAKDVVIKYLNSEIEYERSQKDKYKTDYDNLVKDFYTIFQHQDIVPRKR